MSLAEFKWLLTPLKSVYEYFVETFSLLRTALCYSRFYHYYHYRGPHLGPLTGCSDCIFSLAF